MTARRSRYRDPGEQHWFRRTVDQNGLVLDVVIKRRRDLVLLNKLLKSTDTSPQSYR
ncbi:hypothetical protein HAP41_0000047290 (plasmid) [Bradyrhizobium barranii subsp. apii]|uniref:Uncharacterized protein n=1 Tax=Bradyrhizobium barranii subsp. apii TaxID=2819348 RepID=A0A8T5VRK1_9BRAD|nr:hypothetical protein [Bradyrhizobium barranii]UPT92205.1 hypothetical protein HAP41_0000047290 [Bradyrhizobium barranii subsp. apii]